MSSIAKDKDILIVILAGGQSTRMGTNVFKPLVELQGKPLLLYVYHNLSQLSNEFLVIVKNENQKRLVQNLIHNSEVKVIVDSFKFSSPLAGILTATQNTTKKILLPVGADQIFLSKDVVKSLLTHLDNQVDAVVPKWPNGYIEPLGAVYKRVAIFRFIDKPSNIKEASLHGFLRNIKVKYVDIFSVTKNPDISYFNINTLNDLKKAKEILSSMF